MKINVPEDGSMPFVEGSKAVVAEVQHRASKDGKALQVRFQFDAVGEDALHAGSAKVVVTLTKPEPVPNSDKPLEEQAKIGADYGALFLKAAEHIVGTQLQSAFSYALTERAEEQEAKQDEQVNTMANLCMAIAFTLLMKNGGDKAKAKAEADFRANPDIMAIAKEHGLTEDTLDVAIDGIRKAIDLTDVAG